MEYDKIPKNPVCVVLKLAGARWKLLIIKELLNKDFRFVELKKKLGCTSKVLSNCLKEMERDGLVVKSEIDLITKQSVYFLSDIGYSMRPIIESMQKWGVEYKKLRKLQSKNALNEEV